MCCLTRSCIVRPLFPSEVHVLSVVSLYRVPRTSPVVALGSSSPSLRHIGLNSYVINFVLFVHRSIWVLKNPQAGGST